MEKVPCTCKQEGSYTRTHTLSLGGCSDEEEKDCYDSLLKSLDLQFPNDFHAITHQELHLLIQGKYCDLIVNKDNSKELQIMIENAGQSIVLDIFTELKSVPDFSDYLIHIYSNYFMNKLYIKLEFPIYDWQYEGSRLEFLDLVFIDFAKVACSSVGTFFIQNLIQSFSSRIEEERFLTFLLETPASTLIVLLTVSNNHYMNKNKYSYYIFESLISVPSGKYNFQLVTYILETSILFFNELLNTKSGLSLLKAFNNLKLSSDSPHYELFRVIQCKIEKRIVEIAMNKYGVHLIASIFEVRF